MNSNFAFFSKQQIIDFARSYIKKIEGKNADFFGSLILSKIFEIEDSAESKIGFLVKSKFLRKLNLRGPLTNISSDLVMKILQNGIEDDSLTDFIIQTKNSLGEIKRRSFQMKRFGVGESGKDTESLINELKSIHLKYSRAEEFLILFLGKTDSLDRQRVRKWFVEKGSPFARVIFLWQIDQEFVRMDEIYPQDAIMNIYSLEQIMS